MYKHHIWLKEIHSWGCSVIHWKYLIKLNFNVITCIQSPKAPKRRINTDIQEQAKKHIMSTANVSSVNTIKSNYLAYPWGVSLVSLDFQFNEHTRKVEVTYHTIVELAVKYLYPTNCQMIQESHLSKNIVP